MQKDDNRLLSGENPKKNKLKLRGGITVEQFQCMVTTVSAVEKTEEAEARWMDYWLKYTKEIERLEIDQMSKVVDILFRAKYIENIMDMSVQEVLQIPEENLEL